MSSPENRKRYRVPVAVLGLGAKTRKRYRLLLGLGLLLLAACGPNMRDQPRYEPYEESAFFADRRVVRAPVPNTVARGFAQDDDHFFRGEVDGEHADTFPMPVTRELLERGRERFEIFCAPCHGFLGYGDGMIVQRGFSPPPSFHTDELRGKPVGHYYEVITDGLGLMAPYADRVPPHDRWAIIAYIRALQLSQHAPLEAVPPEEREGLLEEGK